MWWIQDAQKWWMEMPTRCHVCMYNLFGVLKVMQHTKIIMTSIRASWNWMMCTMMYLIFVQLQLRCYSIGYSVLHTQVKWIIPLNITRPRSPSLCDHLLSLSDCCRACEFIQHLSTLNFSGPPGEWVSCWQSEYVCTVSSPLTPPLAEGAVRYDRLLTCS